MILKRPPKCTQTSPSPYRQKPPTHTMPLMPPLTCPHNEPPTITPVTLLAPLIPRLTLEPTVVSLSPSVPDNTWQEPVTVPLTSTTLSHTITLPTPSGITTTGHIA